MPTFNNPDLFEQTLPESGFQFSALRPDCLGATEYTLTTIAMDVSGSVDGFAAGLLDALKAIVGACKRSPRADNLLVRLVTFNQNVTEVHGFLPADRLDPDQYALFQCHGGTALHDAACSALGATRAYGATLLRQDYAVNGIVFLVTDGEDNQSAQGARAVRDAGKALTAGEELDGLRTVLIGVNAAGSRAALEAFRKEAGIDEFVEVEKADAASLARLAGFISRSISAQSRALGGMPAPAGGLGF